MKSSELKFGDTFMHGGRVAVYLRAFPLFPCLEDAGALLLLKDDPAPLAARLEDDVEVLNRPRLTPAQQHAEKLLELVRDAADLKGISPRNARAVVNQIDPPKPPTLDEALAVLAGLRSVPGSISEAVKLATVADALLKRARRAGLTE